MVSFQTEGDRGADFEGVTNAARDCLRRSPYKAVRGVSCECRQGVLVLKGRLRSFYYKQVAQEAVANVEGAISVVNEIAVE